MPEKKQSKTRNYASILYPESAVEGWRELLSASGIPCIISPLHDKDLKKEVVSSPEWADITKKAHHHIMICFDGPKFIEQAQTVFDSIGAIRCIRVESLRGMARYFCHLDEADKVHYSPSDVVCLGGLDYDTIINLPSDDVQNTIDMMMFITNNQIFSFKSFADICAASYPDWFNLLYKRNSFYIKEYIKSALWEFQHPQFSDYNLAKNQSLFSENNS